MSLKKSLDLMLLIDGGIRGGQTGSPNIFAQRLGISESYLYRIIGDLKAMGAPIVYSRNKNSYIYTQNVMLKLGYEAVNCE